MAQEGPGADCGSDARPFLPLGRVIRIPFSDLQQERWQDCLGWASFSIALGDFFGRRQSRSGQRTHVRKGSVPDPCRQWSAYAKRNEEASPACALATPPIACANRQGRPRLFEPSLLVGESGKPKLPEGTKQTAR